MKLNHDLIRELLIYIEDSSDTIYNPEIDGYTLNEIIYHLVLLKEGGYILGELAGIKENKFRCHRLTLQGHLYLENIRDKYIWDSIKKDLELKGIRNASMDIFRDLANKFIREKIGM